MNELIDVDFLWSLKLDLEYLCTCLLIIAADSKNMKKMTLQYHVTVKLHHL